MRLAFIWLVACATPFRGAPSTAPASLPPIPPMPSELQRHLQSTLDNDPPSILAAAAAGDLQEIQRLVRSGADVNATPDPLSEDFAWTALMAARARNHVVIVKLLEDAGGAEECHIRARAESQVELHATRGGRIVDQLPAGTHLVVSHVQRGWFLVHVGEHGIGREGARRGWTRSRLAAVIEDARSAPHPNGPFGDLIAGRRMLSCHAYTTLVTDAQGRHAWVRAVRGGGWGG